MVKRSKRVVGIAMAGVMAISTVYKVAGSINEVRVAKADNLNGLYNMSSELADAKAKISHLTKSLKTNYLGIKNQGQWEVYVNEARNLIAKIPLSEGETALELTTEVDKDMELINALARINKVEKSYEVNFRGIKNAKQWREYLNLASKSLKLVDQGVFANQYGELISRMNLVSGGVKKIEDDFKKEIEAATKLYEKAKELMKIEDVNKALLVAEKLGSCEESETLKTKIKELKGLIEKGNIDVRSIAVEGKTYDDDTKDQILTLIVNGEAMNINYLRGSGYEVNFVQTSEPNSGDKLFDGQSRTSKTGKLANVITTGNYEVEVTVSKKGNIFVSNRAKIVVENIGSIATSISGFELTNFAEDRDINDPTISAQIKDDIIQKSRTLVVGEDAKITSINTPEVKNIKGGFEIKSSNDAVISVGNRKGVKDVITANSPGEAKLTITYGKAVQEIKITVKSASRKATKIVYRGGYIATAKKQIVDVKVSIYDQ
ncbi:MAG: hypothetical protein RR582_05675, partial [Niameybacter sp.]